MKVLIVVECDVPEVDAIAEVLRSIDPPNIAHFAGVVRVVPEPHATELQKWLDA